MSVEVQITGCFNPYALNYWCCENTTNESECVQPNGYTPCNQGTFCDDIAAGISNNEPCQPTFDITAAAVPLEFECQTPTDCDVYNSDMICLDNFCNHDTFYILVDDGTCDFGTAALGGCTDPAAQNYNPVATDDDGSCFFTNCFI